MHRLLVVEDHKRLLKSLERGLVESGYEVESAETAEDAFYLASTRSFDGVILDIMLPRRSGLEILRDLRAAGMDAPVLILSARDSVEDRVRGLDEGADDYLTKPFAFQELAARVRALLNRRVSFRRVTLEADNLELDVSSQRVTRGGEVISLSRQEFRLLEYLLRHKNQSVDRQTIAQEVWGEPQGLATNSVDVHINALRKKLERPQWNKLIHTVRGVGYMLREIAATEPSGLH